MERADVIRGLRLRLDAVEAAIEQLSVDTHYHARLLADLEDIRNRLLIESSRTAALEVP